MPGALSLFLEVVRIRPLYARAASDNAGSLRVLGKTGFRIIDTEVSFAPGAWSRNRRDDPAVGLADKSVTMLVATRQKFTRRPQPWRSRYPDLGDPAH